MDEEKRGFSVGEGLAASAIAAAMLGIRRAFEDFAVSMSGVADAIRAAVSALEEIEREEARRRVLGWEGIWLWS